MGNNAAQPSIGKKLFLSLGSTLLILWLGVVGAVALVVEHETGEIFDSGLQETAQRLLLLAERDLSAAGQPVPWPAFVAADHEEYLVYQVFNSAGKLLLRSHNAPSAPLRMSPAQGFYDVGLQRIYVDATPDGQLVIQVGEFQGHRQETFENILTYLLLPLLGLLPLAGLAVYWSVRSAQKPIERFDREIAGRGVDNLQPLSLEHLPVELGGVGKSVNLLLERLRLALEAERSFTANSAHELRTPVATAMAQLQVLQAELNPVSRERVVRASEMLERLQRMIVKLLQLARVESGVALSDERFDLGMLLGMLCRDFALASKRQIIFQPLGHPVWVRGDIDAIGIAVQNLYENADRHGTPGATIEIELNPKGCVVFSNDAEAVAPEKLQDLCQRFVRGNQGGPGSGLGLSIVEAIARQSGGDIRLTSPCYENGRGFSARLCLRLDVAS